MHVRVVVDGVSCMMHDGKDNVYVCSCLESFLLSIITDFKYCRHAYNIKPVSIEDKDIG